VGPLRRSQAPPLRLVQVTRPRRCSIGRRSCPSPPGSAAFPSAGPARTSLSVPPVRPLGHGPHRSVTLTWVSRQYFARSVRWSMERPMSPRHTSARRTIRPPEVAWLTHPRSCHRALARLKESTPDCRWVLPPRTTRRGPRGEATPPGAGYLTGRSSTGRIHCMASEPAAEGPWQTPRVLRRSCSRRRVMRDRREGVSRLH
jgi:hypothetical protein